MRKRSVLSIVRILLLLCVTVQLAGTALWGRDKTDVVLLKNGDHLTGEIKGLERGKLSLSTDSMGTVAIEWPAVQSVTSQYTFEVEAETGLKVFGLLRPAVEERMEIVGEESEATLELPSVVHMTPLEAGFFGESGGICRPGIQLHACQPRSAVDTGKRSQLTYSKEEGSGHLDL